MEKQTEQRNMRTVHLDSMTSAEIVAVMLDEDRRIVDGILPHASKMAQAVDEIVNRWKKGGRVFVIGAGTSGRIGMLDAVELGPTFSVESSRWTAIVAGGNEAMWQPLEETEDDESVIEAKLQSKGLTENDTVIGMTASGSTPFALAGLRQAKQVGALTVIVTNNEGTPASFVSDIAIEAVVGPEVLRGSTRLKAGTAQKIVLNILSTGVMVRLGRVYGNEMVDMKLINQKLVSRAAGMIQTIADVSEEEAYTILKRSEFQLKEALFTALTDASPEEAARYLQQADRHVKKAVTLFFGIDK
jgi:N-acetylmuramic acid 6-phosphate etherase